MEIEWFGGNRFKLRCEGTVVAMEMEGSADAGWDIVTFGRPVSTSDGGGSDPGPFVIDGPGEYEVSDVFVVGVSTGKSAAGANPAVGSTIFAVAAGGVTVCHAGDGAQVPSRADVDALGPIDVLLLSPAAGNAGERDILSEMISRLDPAIIIPMEPTVTSEGADVDKILKLVGGSNENTAELRRLDVVADHLPEETQLVRLARQPADQA